MKISVMASLFLIISMQIFAGEVTFSSAKFQPGIGVELDQNSRTSHVHQYSDKYSATLVMTSMDVPFGKSECKALKVSLKTSLNSMDELIFNNPMMLISPISTMIPVNGVMAQAITSKIKKITGKEYKFDSNFHFVDFEPVFKWSAFGVMSDELGKESAEQAILESLKQTENFKKFWNIDRKDVVCDMLNKNLSISFKIKGELTYAKFMLSHSRSHINETHEIFVDKYQEKNSQVNKLQAADKSLYMAALLGSSLNESSERFEDLSVEKFGKLYNLYVDNSIQVRKEITNFNIQKFFGSAISVRTPVKFEVSFDDVEVMEDL